MIARGHFGFCSPGCLTPLGQLVLPDRTSCEKSAWRCSCQGRGVGSVTPKPLLPLGCIVEGVPTPHHLLVPHAFQHPLTGQVWDYEGTTGPQVLVITGV